MASTGSASNAPSLKLAETIVALTEDNAALRTQLSEAEAALTSLRTHYDKLVIMVELLSNPQASAEDTARRVGNATLETAAPKSRKPRSCTCCGQEHADSRTCGRAHVCLAGKCNA